MQILILFEEGSIFQHICTLQFLLDTHTHTKHITFLHRPTHIKGKPVSFTSNPPHKCFLNKNKKHSFMRFCFCLEEPLMDRDRSPQCYKLRGVGRGDPPSGLKINVMKHKKNFIMN